MVDRRATNGKTVSYSRKTDNRKCVSRQAEYWLFLYRGRERVLRILDTAKAQLISL